MSKFTLRISNSHDSRMTEYTCRWKILELVL